MSKYERGTGQVLNEREHFKVQHGAEAYLALGNILEGILPIAPVAWFTNKDNKKEEYWSEKSSEIRAPFTTLILATKILNRIFSDYDKQIYKKEDGSICAGNNVFWDSETQTGYLYDLEEGVNFFFHPDGHEGFTEQDVEALLISGVSLEEIQGALQKILDKVSGKEGLNFLRKCLSGKRVDQVFYLKNYYHGDVGSHLDEDGQIALFQSVLIDRLQKSLGAIASHTT